MAKDIKKISETDIVRVNPDVIAPSFSDVSKLKRISNDAINLLHKRIKDGTATSQELCKALTLEQDYEQYEIEKERAMKELTLIDAKVEDLKSHKDTQALMEKAIEALKGYSGEDPEEENVGDIPYVQ